MAAKRQPRSLISAKKVSSSTSSSEHESSDALLRVLLLLVGIAVFDSAQMRCKADDRPGAKEQAEVDSANAVLDRVYRDLMSKAEPEEKTSLQEAERAWIKWGEMLKRCISRVTASRRRQ